MNLPPSYRLGFLLQLDFPDFTVTDLRDGEGGTVCAENILVQRAYFEI